MADCAPPPPSPPTPPAAAAPCEEGKRDTQRESTRHYPNLSSSLYPAPSAGGARSHTSRLPPLLLPADSQLELIARVVGWLNAVMDAFQGARAWLVARPAVLAALAVLLLALLLRWLGWV